MKVERADLLKEWLSINLKKCSDADPHALGKYVFALIKKKDKKKGGEDLKTFLLEALEVFLNEQTSTFVELLLGTLQTKSYLKKLSDDVAIYTPELSSASPVAIPPITSSQPTTTVKNISDTNTDIFLKDKKTKPHTTNDITEKSPHSSFSIDNSSLQLKRKSVFDDKHNSPNEKKCCKSSNSKEEFLDVYGEKLSSKLEVKYLPGVTHKSKPDDIEPLSPKKIKITHDSTPPRDCDYRERKNVDLQSNTIVPLADNVPPFKQRECPSYCTKPSTRCKDYDEKGYCLKGNNCGFDHGSDPILVEHTPNVFLTSLNSVNFGYLPSDKYEGTKSPLPPLPTSPPRIPPLPPLPPATGFVAEPYNPEAPGMNMITHLNFFNPSEPPPELPSMMPKSSTRMQSLYFGKSDYKPKQGRIRELINVCEVTKTNTVDSSNKQLIEKSENKDDGTHLKPLNSVSTNHSYGHFKAKRFDFSRLGPCPCTLEIRKIPSRQNTISNLVEHFSKFGKIVNIEIGADKDPESAKISFSCKSEATAAYRSTDAILNNRFIKVFWSHDTSREKRRTDNIFFANEINAKDISSSSPENLKDNITQLNDGGLEDKMLDKINENILIPPTASMPRTVFISSHQGVKKFPIGATKKGTHEREDIASHKIKLHHAKNELIQKLVTQQKIILAKLIKATKNSEKVVLKKSLESLAKQIGEITADFKKDNEALKNFLQHSTPEVAVSKFAAKELLDAELDLYKKQHTHSDEETELLLKKVSLMKTKAKTLGLLETFHAPKSAFRRNASSRSVDHRPKKFLVSGKNGQDKEGLKKHFKNFGEIENLEEVSGGIVISFNTRAEAEKAFFYGNKFEDSILSLAWVNDLQLNATSHTLDSNEKPEQKAVEMIEIEDEEEEEEEEARSWRH